MKKILFVCTGNTCRSPIAEAFMRAALSGDPKLSAEFHASSAGISAYPGERASSHSLNVMSSEWSIDISRHSASSLDEKSVREAFLILTMTTYQKEYLTSSYPDACGKTYTLKEFSNGGHASGSNGKSAASLDITDPYGHPLQVYSKCAAEIREAVYKLADILKKS